MNLRYKKLIAKEIILLVFLIVAFLIVYFTLSMYDRKVRCSNAELSNKIKNINDQIEAKTDSIANLHSLEVITVKSETLKPWERYAKNGKPKFNPNKSYEIIDEFGNKKIVNPKKDSLIGIKYQRQILKLAEEQKIFESQINSSFDLKSSVEKFIILLLLLAYPIRILILGTFWSVKILKRKEN